MDKETMIQTIQNIGACEDLSERLVMLTSLQDELVKVYDSNETDKTTIDTLNKTLEEKETNIDKLQKANMDLFLRLGVDVTEQEKLKNSTGEQPDEDNRRRFEDLFKEGGLKL